MKNERAHSRVPIQLFRVAALVVPSAIAWDTAFSAPHPSQLTSAVTYALAPLWVLMAGALLSRLLDAVLRRHRGETASLLDHVDVLTASGSALAWMSGAAIVAAIKIGWASLSIVGLMGLGLLHLVVLWTCAVARGADPFRRAGVTRRFVPEHVVEGASVTEELHLHDLRIPAGFRLFASGRVGPRWATSRYAIDDAESGGEIVMEREIGPALRGEHQAEPLSLWLQDMFGLCRTPRVPAGEARLTVLPRARAVEGMETLLSQGGSLLDSRPATKLPTEGHFRLREYQPGDDARRIHWLRSLSAREVVMRTPDELPPDRPRVRLVLDTYLPGAGGLSCNAPAELLDALVAVWLGAGDALVKSGARVTMVAAVPRGDGVAVIKQPLAASMPMPSLRLGASARWQEKMPVGELVDKEPTIVVSYRLQPDRESGQVRWIVVPEPMWTRFDGPPQMPSIALLPHAVGSADNRWSRRRRDRMQRDRARRDHRAFGDLTAHAADRRPGSFFAWPQGRNSARLEAAS